MRINAPTDNIPAGQQVRTTKHKLLCEAMLKFLPYDSFILLSALFKLGEIFSQSLNDISLEGGNASLRTALAYFAPNYSIQFYQIRYSCRLPNFY